MHLQTKTSNPITTGRGHLLKRMGLTGFAFFFLKGLMWLLIPWLTHSAIF